MNYRIKSTEIEKRESKEVKFCRYGDRFQPENYQKRSPKRQNYEVRSLSINLF